MQNKPHFHRKQTQWIKDGGAYEYCTECDWRQEIEDIDHDYDEEIDMQVAERGY